MVHRARPLPLLLFPLAIGGLAATTSAQHPGPMAADRATGAAAVTLDQARQWLGTLASPEFEGRGTGQDGFRKAADFVRDQFAALQLQPGGDDGSWFQSLNWSQRKPDIAASRVVFQLGEHTLTVPGARLSGSVQSAVAAKGTVVLLPAGADNAIEAANLDGKIVIVLLPPPDASDGSDGRRRRGRPNYPFQTMRALQGKSTAAVLLAQREAATSPLQGSSGPAGNGGVNRAARGARLFPTVVAFGGDDLGALLQLAGLPATPEGKELLPLPVECEITVPVADEAAPASNVIGILRGSDPKLADEYVVIGSHLDHLGRRGDQYFPGADDDGSGTTGVLSVATMFAKNPQRPARSILFVCFCGEEMGLLGSRHFVEHPPIPLASIVGELQMDMIGRDEEEARDGGRLVNKGETAEDNRNSLHLVGTRKLSPALHALCMAKNETAGFDLEWDQEGMFSRSDHANFGRMGVPMAFFFTGLHMDYHQVTDTPDKIHYEKLLRVATYVYDIAFELGQAGQRPQIDAGLWRDYDDKGSAEPAAPMLPTTTDK